MSSYDQLRFSFDNILKELDDICKGIDYISESFPDKEINSNVHTQSFVNSSGITHFNINSSPFFQSEQELKLIEESFHDIQDEEKLIKNQIEANKFVDEKEDLLCSINKSGTFLSFEHNSSNPESIEVSVNYESNYVDPSLFSENEKPVTSNIGKINIF